MQICMTSCPILAEFNLISRLQQPPIRPCGHSKEIRNVLNSKCFLYISFLCKVFVTSALSRPVISVPDMKSFNA